MTRCLCIMTSYMDPKGLGFPVALVIMFRHSRTAGQSSSLAELSCWEKMCL